MLYNQLLEPISTEGDCRNTASINPSLHTPRFTIVDKTLIPTPLFPLQAAVKIVRGLSHRRRNDSKNGINFILKQALATRKVRV